MERARIEDGDIGTFLFGRDGAMLRKIIDNAAIGMAVSAMDGAVLYTNHAFGRDFAFSGTGAPHLRDMFDPADADAAEALAAVMAGRREQYEGEHRCRGASGGTIWAMVAMSVLRSDVTGAPMYVIAQLGSIDARKRAEEALAASESRWHFALESARQGVWDHHTPTGSMFYSPMWRTMRGIPQDEAVDGSQQGWLARVHPDDRERVASVVNRQNEGEDGYDILEYRERHRDGHYIWILSRGKPVEWDEDGNVVRTVGTDTDITHLKRIEAQLEHAATHDSLTGLANRAAFQSALAKAAGAGGHALLFIDLDRFKPVNDALGHAAGDAVLVSVAAVISAAARRNDFAARLGGDEFAVLLRDCGPPDARAVAERIVAGIGTIPVTIEDAPHVLGASIGLVQLCPGADPDSALARADAACYAAKKTGRGRIVLAE